MAVNLTGYLLFSSDFSGTLAWWQAQIAVGNVQPPVQNSPPSQQVRGALAASDYAQTLRNLLPYGPAWTDDPSAAISQVLDGLSQELSRIDARCWALITEADPRSTMELFNDWQREFGLPDSCVAALGGMQSDAQLRAALLGRITNVAGATPAYFVTMAEVLGFSVRITEFLGSDTPYQWQVDTSIADSLTRFSFASTFSTPWAHWGSALLECVLKRLAPAHTDLVFSYT